MKKRITVLLTVILALSCLAGCAGPGADTIATDGSTSMSKVIGALGEAFENDTGTKDTCLYRQKLSSNGDVITTVANNPNAIGYASLATIKDSVRALSDAALRFFDYATSGAANELISAASVVPAN